MYLSPEEHERNTQVAGQHHGRRRLIIYDSRASDLASEHVGEVVVAVQEQSFMLSCMKKAKCYSGGAQNPSNL